MEKYVHELSNALATKGHHSIVIAGAHEEGLPEHEFRENVELYRFPAHRSPLRCRVWLWRHVSIFRSADIVNISNTHMLEYFRRMLGPMVPRRKIFLIRHGMKCQFPVPQDDKKRAVRSCRHVAAVAHDGEFIEKWLGVKPDLCPLQGLNPRAEDITAVTAPPPDSAIYIGRLEPDTGIRIYVDAVRRLKEEHSMPFRMDVFGDGSLRAELESTIARYKLPIRLMGRVPNAQDRIEDYGFAFIDGRMAIQEAMARRRLVFAAYVDPLKYDYVGTEAFSPFLVRVGGGSELARQVLHFIENTKGRDYLVEQAYRFACTLDWHKTAESYLAMWQSRQANTAQFPFSGKSAPLAGRSTAAAPA